MVEPEPVGRWKWRPWASWAFVGMLGLCPLIGAVLYLARPVTPVEADASEPNRGGATEPQIRVDVIRPEKGKMPRTTHQTGTVLSFDSARLYAEVSGYLDTEAVDIGDHVTKGQVLAKIDVPELVKQLVRASAVVAQANAHVKVAEARLDSARADLKAAQAKVVQVNATARSAKAWRVFREKQFHRMQDLFALKSIDERVVDEHQDQAEAAAETERSAHAAISTAEAEEEAARAKIKQAEADIASANADVKVAEAELGKAEVMVNFATIRSPYTGYVTQRSMLPGDFVRAGTEGSGIAPLLTVERTDKMRIVIQVPDRDVPYCNPGDPATVEIDALPGKKYQAQVARIARSEDTQTKLMRVEIDLPNPTGDIRQGMYGWVTIFLNQGADHLSIPSACLVGKAQHGHGSVYVVREGHAHLVPVQIGADNGTLVAIQSGLTIDDAVVVQPSSQLHDGAPVEASAVVVTPKASEQ